MRAIQHRYSSSALRQHRMRACCASSVLLGLLTWHPTPAHAQYPTPEQQQLQQQVAPVKPLILPQMTEQTGKTKQPQIEQLIQAQESSPLMHPTPAPAQYPTPGQQQLQQQVAPVKPVILPQMTEQTGKTKQQQIEQLIQAKEQGPKPEPSPLMQKPSGESEKTKLLQIEQLTRKPSPAQQTPEVTRQTLLQQLETGKQTQKQTQAPGQTWDPLKLVPQSESGPQLKPLSVPMIAPLSPRPDPALRPPPSLEQLQQLQQQMQQQVRQPAPAVVPGVGPVQIHSMDIETALMQVQQQRSSGGQSATQAELEALKARMAAMLEGTATNPDAAKPSAPSLAKPLAAGAEEKYQKLVDAGIFSSPTSPASGGNVPALQATTLAASVAAPIPNAASSAAVGAATTAGVAGLSTGSLAAVGASVLAAAAAAAAASASSANDIALSNAASQASNNLNNVTARANWPTNLNATFSGRLSGTLSDSSAVGGNLSMQVNFATIGSHAPIPGSVQFDNNKGSATLSLVQSGGYVGGGMNGTYNNQAMTGYIRNGQFYGPAANAIKGSWDMSTSSVSGGGTFAANR